MPSMQNLKASLGFRPGGGLAAGSGERYNPVLREWDLETARCSSGFTTIPGSAFSPALRRKGGEDRWRFHPWAGLDTRMPVTDHPPANRLSLLVCQPCSRSTVLSWVTEALNRFSGRGRARCWNHGRMERLSESIVDHSSFESRSHSMDHVRAREAAINAMTSGRPRDGAPPSRRPRSDSSSGATSSPTT